MWQGQVILIYVLTALPLRACYIQGVLSLTLSRLCYDHGMSMPRQRRPHYALNRFCRCLPRPCTFAVDSHCVFVTSRYLSINTRFNFSYTSFCFNHDTVSMNPKNSTFQLPLVLLQEHHTLPDEEVGLLMVQRRRRGNRRRPRSCLVRPCLKEGCSLVI